MEPVDRDRHVRAFKATDAFTIETYRIARTLAVSGHGGLVRDIRRSAVRSGAALVAASTSPPGGTAERRLLERARSDLAEARYYLYLARRVGLLDLRRYRGLTTRQDVALKELDMLLRPTRSFSGRAPP